jgi:hypothetical protein
MRQPDPGLPAFSYAWERYHRCCGPSATIIERGNEPHPESRALICPLRSQSPAAGRPVPGQHSRTGNGGATQTGTELAQAGIAALPKLAGRVIAAEEDYGCGGCPVERAPQFAGCAQISVRGQFCLFANSSNRKGFIRHWGGDFRLLAVGTLRDPLVAPDSIRRHAPVANLDRVV